MRGVKRGRRGAAQQMLPCLAAAGSEGLTIGELREQLEDCSRSAMYTALHTAQQLGQVAVQKVHPIAIYFDARVPEDVQRATFDRRCREIRTQRGQAVAAGTLAHCNRQRRAAGRPALSPALPTHRSPRSARGLPAVDPASLRPDATVTYPPGLQTVICPGYRSLSERMAAQSSPQPLPAEPPSRWVQAVLQARTHTSTPEAA